MQWSRSLVALCLGGLFAAPLAPQLDLGRYPQEMADPPYQVFQVGNAEGGPLLEALQSCRRLLEPRYRWAMVENPARFSWPQPLRVGRAVCLVVVEEGEPALDLAALPAHMKQVCLTTAALPANRIGLRVLASGQLEDAHGWFSDLLDVTDARSLVAVARKDGSAPRGYSGKLIHLSGDNPLKKLESVAPFAAALLIGEDSHVGSHRGRFMESTRTLGLPVVTTARWCWVLGADASVLPHRDQAGLLLALQLMRVGDGRTAASVDCPLIKRLRLDDRRGTPRLWTSESEPTDRMRAAGLLAFPEKGSSPAR